MRLSPKEIKSLKAASSQVLGGIPHTLFLYGSRTEAHKKGGDIDLLILVQSQEAKELAVTLKTRMRMRIFDFLPEQKIDITVATEEELQSEPFFQSLTKIAL